MKPRKVLHTIATTARSRLLPQLRKAHAWTGSMLDWLESASRVKVLDRVRWTRLTEPVLIPPELRYRYVPRSEADGVQIALVARLTTPPRQGPINVACGDDYRQAMERADAYDAPPTPGLAPVGTNIHECYFDFEMPTEFEDLLARMEGRPGMVDVHFDDEGPNVTRSSIAIE